MVFYILDNCSTYYSFRRSSSRGVGLHRYQAHLSYFELVRRKDSVDRLLGPRKSAASVKSMP